MLEKLPNTEEDKLINLSEKSNINDNTSNPLQSDNSSSLFNFLNRNKSLLKKLEITNNNISTNSSFNKSNSTLINSEKTDNNHLKILNKINTKVTNKLSKVYSYNEYQPINYEIINRGLFKKEKISKIIWDHIISIIIFYFSLYTPYNIAFQDYTKINLLEIIADIFLIIDIILNFFTAYYNSLGILIMKKRYITKHYLQGFFLIDFISVLPIFNLFFYNESFNNYIMIFKTIRIIQMKKKIINIHDLAYFIFHKLSIDKKFVHLILLITVFIIFNHFFACLWFFLSRIKKFSSDTWLSNLGYNDKSNFEKYVISFYWTLTT